MEAKQLILSNQDVKFLSDLIEMPKTTGFNRDGQAIQEGISTDTGRKILNSQKPLLKAMQSYMDALDAIVEQSNADLRDQRDDEDDDEQVLARKQTARNRIGRKGQQDIEALNKTVGREEVNVFLSEIELKFITGRFDDRHDLIAQGDLLRRVVAISDALAAAAKTSVEMSPVRTDAENGDGKIGLNYDMMPVKLVKS